MTEYSYEKDASGIVTVTFDAPGKSANTMTSAWLEAMFELVEKLEGEQGLAGVVLASAKNTFFAGGDLDDIYANDLSASDLMSYIERNKTPFRLLEQLPVPVVAAINGAALGGGFEMCLACNHRVIVNSSSAVVGLPEVQLGLLPGAGGIVRLTAKIGLEAALPLLLEGTRLKPEQALKARLVEQIVESPEDLIPAAKAWIKNNPDAGLQPWDQKGFKYPGGNADAPNIRMIATMAPTMLFKKTRGLMPAPEKILDIAVNSMRMGFDSALRAESRGIVALIPTPECKAAIGTFFFGMQSIKSGRVRPKGEKWTAKSSAVIGAGMMGSGIAYAHASRGIETVLKDISKEAADKGKAQSEKLLAVQVERGRLSEDDTKSVLSRIVATDDDTALNGVDIIIEAVFENIEIKERLIAETFDKLSPDGVYGSNTSSLPISVLAEACPDPSRFIGLHFFSPVHKMKIVEIICGKKTSEETLRKAYDYVQQIGYTPIVVNDSPGFFTSRVFGTYLDEGQALLRDGMNPVAIERAGWLSGMPVGPLAVHDEVSLVLTKKAFDTHKNLDKRQGMSGHSSEFNKFNRSTEIVGHHMVEIGRGGRHYGGGFYEYAADGTKSIWRGLDQFVEKDLSVSLKDAVDRLLFRQAIESLRCLSEGVLNNEVDGNLGSVLAIGFPPHTGGALQFIRGIGLEAFKKRADELAAKYGERFAFDDDALDLLRHSVPKVA